MANADRLIELFNEAKTRPGRAERERFLKEQWPAIRKTIQRLGLSAQELLGLGRENPLDRHEAFCMTVLALNLSRQ